MKLRALLDGGNKKLVPTTTSQQLLVASVETVSYVKRMLPLGEGNQPSRILDRGVIDHFKIIARISDMRDEIDNKMNSNMIADDNWAVSVNIMAEAAIKHKCGNCGEQSALAFVHLRRKQTAPIDWLAYRSNLLWNHAFVMLGRPANGGPHNLDQWVDGAFICDPYYDYAGPLRPVVKRYHLDSIITGAPLLRFESEMAPPAMRLPIWKNL